MLRSLWPKVLIVLIIVFLNGGVADAQVSATQQTPVCAMRTSVLESYAPFSSALSAGRTAATFTKVSSEAQEAYRQFDLSLAASIASTPNDEDSTLALVDLERLIDTLDNCGQGLGWGNLMLQSRPALVSAFRRNQATLTDPAYASRLLRSATAQSVLRENGQGQYVRDAAAIAQRQQAETAARQAQEARARRIAEERAQAERAQREAIIQRGWRTNPSAPDPTVNICDSVEIVEYAIRPKDTAWLNLMDSEARSGCTRISTRNDGPYYIGLALGTNVTDEQLAHAAGRLYLCFSNTRARRAFDGVINNMRTMNALFGANVTEIGLRPSWVEHANGRGHRIVTIRCGIEMSMVGLDLTNMSAQMAAAYGIDNDSFIQFELDGSRLLTIRDRRAISNEVRSETDVNNITGASSTSTFCDANRANASAIATVWTRAQWTVTDRTPYRFRNSNQQPMDGEWAVLYRDELATDIWNVSYRAPVLGDYGNCYGGIVEHFTTLRASRSTFIRAGVPPSF